MQSFQLSVAGFDFTIFSKSEIQLVIEEGYFSFLTNEKSFNTIQIEVFDFLPEVQKNDFEKVYSAESNEQSFWTIYKLPNGYRIVTFSQTDGTSIQQIADFNFKDWKIYCQPTKTAIESVLCPLQYPLGPLIWYYTGTQNKAIMIHASGINFNNKGKIFSGFSGKGKSTMANLWTQKGATLINDDRVLIREIKDQFFMYNTPMFYEAKPIQTTLDFIYFPFHANENIIKKLTEPEVFKNLFAYIIQHGYNEDQINNHLNLIKKISEQIPAFSIGFVPTTKVVDFILDNE